LADDVRVYVTGLAELRRALRVLEPELLAPLRENLKAAGELIAADARSRVTDGSSPWDRHPGLAKGSIRATAGGNNVYIIGGKAKSAYYGWLDFGGSLKPTGARTNTQQRPVIKKGRYIYPAISAKGHALVQAVAVAFDEAARKAGLT
jgi:hypothetical protein